jgi:asparagine synthase (glutamine-hydrolysing)
MCGVVFLAGPRARARIEGIASRLRHRGPDEQTRWEADPFAMGFTRLEINGPGALGRQPYEHHGLVGGFNGEIYNHAELASEHGLPCSASDTHVILPLLAKLGPRVIDVLDGFYAGVALDPSRGELLCLRDHIGKKPLFVGRSSGEVFVVSELKALDAVEWFAPLPLGASRVDLHTGLVQVLAEHRAQPARGDLQCLVRAAVDKRLPSREQPVGVFLSGGLDSAIVGAIVARTRPDASFFVLGNHDGPDRRAAGLLVDALGLADVRVVPLPSPEDLDTLLRAVVESTESFNPSIVSNGASTYLLARAARRTGIRVVLTGDGADELFGGYHDFRSSDPWNETRQQLIGDMHFTELRRLDLCTMAHGVEARCPFLDRDVRTHAAALGHEELYAHDENKAALRRAFAGVLPSEVVHRRKTSFDVGSGMRRAVVRHLQRNGRSERDELKALWRERFDFDASNSYFSAYPAFDGAIDVRGEAHR